MRPARSSHIDPSFGQIMLDEAREHGDLRPDRAGAMLRRANPPSRTRLTRRGS
jgi:hypothetical protein